MDLNKSKIRLKSQEEIDKKLQEFSGREHLYSIALFDILGFSNFVQKNGTDTIMELYTKLLDLINRRIIKQGDDFLYSFKIEAFTARQWGSLAFDLLPYLWVIGAAALFLAQLLKLYRLRKKLRDAVEISPGVYVSDKLSGR